MPVRLVAVGDLMIDVTISGRGHDASIEAKAGGSALNAALWAVAGGAEAEVVGCVGDDLAGRALTAFLAAAGIGARLAVDPSAPTGTFAVVDGAVRVDQGAGGTLWAPSDRLSADVVLVSGYLPAAVVSAVLGGLDSPLVALGAGRLAVVPAGVDVVLASAAEAERLTGESDPVAAAQQLAEGARLACVTMGADGAVAAAAGEVFRARPAERHGGEARGAGDAFAAGLLLSLAAGDPPERALAAGCELGARAAAAPR